LPRAGPPRGAPLVRGSWLGGPPRPPLREALLREAPLGDAPLRVAPLYPGAPLDASYAGAFWPTAAFA
jgi:hypothetical protein